MSYGTLPPPIPLRTPTEGPPDAGRFGRVAEDPRSPVVEKAHLIFHVEEIEHVGSADPSSEPIETIDVAPARTEPAQEPVKAVDIAPARLEGNQEPVTASHVVQPQPEPVSIVRIDNPAAVEDVNERLDRIEEKHNQAKAIRDTPNDVLERQLDRVKAAEREDVGVAPLPTLVPGLHDSVVWTLRRRFDVQVCHVLAPAVKLPPAEPDLRPSSLPAVPVQLNVLKSNMERVFATLVFKGFIFAREMRRIMLWTAPERPRTLRFCLAYFVLWGLGLLIPGLVSFIIVLIIHVPSRLYFFPHAKPSPEIPVPAKTSTAESSFLLSIPDPALYHDKIQLMYDYAIEGGKIGQHFVARVASGGYTATDEGNGVVGKKSSHREEKAQSREERSNAPSEMFKDMEKKESEWDEERRDEIASEIAKSAQDLLGKVADAIEILQNALSPPAPFPQNNARHRLAFALVPVVVAAPLIPAWMWSYGFGFTFGLVFFGQPVLARGATLFVERVPDWREKLHLRDSLFSGVPTNMQLMLHILRTKEAHFHPLPPPPDLPTDLDVKKELDIDDSDSFDSEAGIIVDDNESIELAEDRAAEESDGEGGKKKGGFKGAIKKVANKVIGTGQTLGQTRQKVGEKVDKRLYHSKAKDGGRNYSFPCKFDGTSGHVNLEVRQGDAPTITFAPLKSSTSDHFPIETLDDLVELKKLGVSAKRALLGKVANIDMEGKGLQMRFKSKQERHRDTFGLEPDRYREDVEGRIMTLEQVHRRDELFARLVSIPGSTRWESL